MPMAAFTVVSEIMIYNDIHAKKANIPVAIVTQIPPRKRGQLLDYLLL